MPRKPTNPAKADKGKKRGAKPTPKAATKPAPKPVLKVVARTDNPKPAPKPAAKTETAAGDTSPAKPKRTIPVHALGDERVHLAVAQLGRLRQGYLKTLCGLQAVTALSPFALADKAQERCRTCFRKVDEDGLFSG